MIRIGIVVATIAAAATGPALAQNCFYNWYGQVVCVTPQYRQPPQQPNYRGNGSPFTRDAGPVIDNSGGCEGGSCVNFGPAYR